MATTGQGARLSVEVRRTLPHPREKVFDAWTTAEALTRWFMPSAAFTTKVVVLEPRVGGRYEIEMHRPDGGVSKALGVYRTVDRPNTLAFTWGWADRDIGETLVTVALFDRGGATELVLTHEGLANEQDREGHSKGWIGCLDQLVAKL